MGTTNMAKTITRHPMKKSFGPSLSISFAMGISPTDMQQVNWDPDQFSPTNPNLPAGVRAALQVNIYRPGGCRPPGRFVVNPNPEMNPILYLAQ